MVGMAYPEGDSERERTCAWQRDVGMVVGGKEERVSHVVTEW
jgi:hypothetical protein